MIYKVCRKCGEEKPINKFYKHKEMTDGYVNICKECVLKRAKIYHENNKTKINKYHQKWAIENKDKLKEYRENNPDKIKIWRNKDYLKHKESYLVRANKYYIENKEKAIEQGRIYNNMKRKTDVKYKILCSLRRRLNHAITKGLKSSRTLELLGCSVTFLKQYLENKFKEGMCWENYGMFGWHIDHIIPCNNFDLTKPEEQRKCFNYINLQPLWAKENRIKHTSIL